MIPEHLKIVDECELGDVQSILDDARRRIQDMSVVRPGYVELGSALVYLSKVDDVIELAIDGVRS